MKLVNLKTYKKGAVWPDGKPRFCNRCRGDGRTRRRQAVVVGEIKSGGFRVPVAYCKEHTP